MQVLKRPGRPFYYARWQFNGTDYLRSTRKQARREALDIAKRMVAECKGKLILEDEFERLSSSLRRLKTPKERTAFLPSAVKLLNTLIESEGEEARQELRVRVVRELHARQKHKLAIADGWKVWHVHSNREYEPKKATLLGYEAIWSRFRKWADSKQIDFLHELTKEHALDYAADLWNSGVSPSTFNQHITFLRAAFTLMETEAGLVGNAWMQVKNKEKLKGEGRRNLSEEELRTVLSHAQGNLRMSMYIGLFTGLRLGDVMNLRWENIEFDPWIQEARPGLIVVKPLKTQRRDKKLEIPMHTSLITMLQARRGGARPTDYLFPKEQAAWKIHVTNVTRSIQDLFEKCGIQTTEKAQHGHRRRAIVRVGFHSLRHSFVSLCTKARTPLHVVQKLVGHGSPAMTDHYAHADTEQKREAIAALPDFKIEDSSAKQIPKGRTILKKAKSLKTNPVVTRPISLSRKKST